MIKGGANMIKGSKRKVLLRLAILLCSVILVLIFGLFWIAYMLTFGRPNIEPLTWPNKSFNAVEWRNDESDRYKMYRSLINEYKLYKMNKTEIIELLGAPLFNYGDSVIYPIWRFRLDKPWQIRSYFVIYLVFYFDDNSKVLRYELNKDD